MVYHKVKDIEKAPLSIDQKVELLLVYANQKPAAILHVSNEENYDPATNTYIHSENQVKQVIKVLDKLNCLYECGETFPFETGWIILRDGARKPLPIKEVTPVYVAQTFDELNRLIAAFQQGDNYELGMLFGYPDTAIQAFIGGRNRFQGELDCGHPEGCFTHFVFSEDFFQEEYYSTSLRWHDVVKRLSPAVYNGLLERGERLIKIKAIEQ